MEMLWSAETKAWPGETADSSGTEFEVHLDYNDSSGAATESPAFGDPHQIWLSSNRNSKNI